VPETHWICTVSRHVTPNSLGHFLDALFIHDATSYPFTTSIPDDSFASLADSIEALFHDLIGVAQSSESLAVDTISIDQSWFSSLDISGAQAALHMSTNLYQLCSLPTPRPECFTFSPGLFALAARTSSVDDLFALYHFYLADHLRHHNYLDSSLHLRKDALCRLILNLIDAPQGPVSRLHALTNDPENFIFFDMSDNPTPRALFPFIDYLVTFFDHFSGIRDELIERLADQPAAVPRPSLTADNPTEQPFDPLTMLPRSSDDIESWLLAQSLQSSLRGRSPDEIETWLLAQGLPSSLRDRSDP
jgi:hypothetical protein